MSHVTCHMSHVTCHMSHVICHISPFLYKLVRSVINGANPSSLHRIALIEPDSVKNGCWTYLYIAKYNLIYQSVCVHNSRSPKSSSASLSFLKTSLTIPIFTECTGSALIVGSLNRNDSVYFIHNNN